MLRKGFILHNINGICGFMNRVRYYMTYKGREERLEYDFMPEMLEIIEKPSNPIGRIIIIIILLFITSAIIWASLFKIDVIVSESGFFVKANEQDIGVAPDDDKLILKVNVKESSFSDINEGMTVNVKMNAYPYNKYGVYEGSVIKKSNIFCIDASMNNCCSVYVLLNDSNNPEILQGMSAVCDFEIGKRTIIEYFLEPVTEGLKNSFQEK